MDRGNVHFIDVLMVFATLVTFVALSTALYPAIREATTHTGPLSATLLRLSMSIVVIGIIASLGVSAKTK